MFQKLENSWELVKASARVLQADKELLIFPVLSGIAVVLVTVGLFVPLAVVGGVVGRISSGGGPAVWITLFLFYFCQYFVIIFFNSALVGAAMIRLEGGDPTVADGFRIAFSRLLPILGWTAIAATVGLLLKRARERSGTLGRMVVGAIGLGWNLATFLVVPVLVTRDVGPIEAVKESARILKRTWGEQIVGNFGLGAFFGLAFLGVGLSGVAGVVLAASTGQAWLVVALVAVVVVLLVLLGVVSSALSGIYTAALYRFATVGEIGAGFEPGMLQQAFVRR